MNRSPMPPRKAPIARGSSPLRRTRLAPASTVPAVFVPQQAAPRRVTGFPERVRLAIWARAGNGDPGSASCERCDRWLGSRADGRGQIQHRVARGMGGCRDTVVNGTAGGVLLCGTPQTLCHGLAEARDEQMLHDGFWLEHGNGPEFDPRFASIMWHSRAGSGVQLWLGTDGQYVFADPGQAAA